MRKLSTIWFAVVVLACGSQAFADVCKSPNVSVKNDKSQTIKVTKFQFYDGCDKRWRTEDVSATEIAPGGQATFKDNLEYVGNCKLSKFKLYRAVRQTTGAAYGAFEWGGELTPDEGEGRACNTGVTFTLHAHDS
jgi:hypothetical protein